jgi:hypothetical protein
MSKGAPAVPADQRRDELMENTLSRRACSRALILGPALGIAVGILNYPAAMHRWLLQDYFFDIADAPVHSMLAAPWQQIGPSPQDFRHFQMLSVEQVMICYWIGIGLFLALLYSLVRTGVVREMVHDRICRYALFFGTCAGAFIGVLSFLAASLNWQEVDQLFDWLNEPAYSLLTELQVRYLNSGPAGPRTRFVNTDTRAQFVFQHSTAVLYWAVIGFVIVSYFCAVRILKKRKAERKSQMPAE